MFTLVNANITVEINHVQALGLELLLNKSIHAKTWRGLGDALFLWRMNPIYIMTDVPIKLNIKREQMTWVIENLSLV